MIPACTITEIIQKLNYRHENDESCVVGIMFARYGIKLTQEIINECYQFWHQWSGNYFDMFWVGYGEYGYNAGDSVTKMTFPGNETYNHFNLNKFIETVAYVRERAGNKWKYKDTLQLVLVNYIDGQLHFNEYIAINLEDNIDNYHSGIRQLVVDIIDKTHSMSSVKEIAKSLKTDSFWRSIKGISISDIISVISSI